jgi:hypothetical protein
MSQITSSLVRKDDRAQVIALFQKLAAEQGLTPQKLVELARDENHVLHRYFEWHDGVAAEKYRQTQARQLIQSIKVRIVTAPEKVMLVRAILSIPADARAGDLKPRYALASDIANDPEAQERIKEQAIIELSRLRRKYDALASLPDFAEIFGVVDKLHAEKEAA